jgi:hypothetical protein
MMFWGDIILHYPQLLRKLPRDLVALNWGYEANHPFETEAELFANSGIPFYVCPGTSTWMTLIGRHDNAFENLRLAARAGKKHGAMGYLNTDWGDGGHPQPLAVSYLPYLAGAAHSWCADTVSESLMVKVLSRDIFHDSSERIAKAALHLGRSHLKFGYKAPNVTPFGTVVATPPPPLRELVCRDGMKYYARIPEHRIRAALEDVLGQLDSLVGVQPATRSGNLLAWELEMATRMAAESCRIMLWQQALTSGDRSAARQLARDGIRDLRELDVEFREYWPLKNKGSVDTCAMFLRWRADDYARERIYFSPEAAQPPSKPQTELIG